MSNCFKNNNVKNAKDYINDKRNNQLFCDYCYDNRWKNDGTILERLSKSKVETTFQKNEKEVTTTKSVNPNSKYYKLSIKSLQNSSTSTGSNKWVMGNDTSLALSKIKFYDEYDNLYDFSSNDISMQIVDIPKDNSIWDIRDVVKHNVRDKINYYNLFSDVSSTYVITGKDPNDNAAAIANRESIDILIKTKNRIKINKISLVNAVDNALFGNGSTGALQNFFPREIEFYVGKKDITDISYVLLNTKVDNILTQTIVFDTSTTTMDETNKFTVNKVNRDFITKDISYSLVKTTNTYIENFNDKPDINSNIFKVNNKNKILKANNHSNYIKLKKGIHNKLLVVNKKILSKDYGDIDISLNNNNIILNTRNTKYLNDLSNVNIVNTEISDLEQKIIDERKKLKVNSASTITSLENTLKSNNDRKRVLEGEIRKLELDKEYDETRKTSLQLKKTAALQDKQELDTSKTTRIQERNTLSTQIDDELTSQKLIRNQKTFNTSTTFINIPHIDKLNLLNNNFTIESTVNPGVIDNTNTLLPLTFTNSLPVGNNSKFISFGCNDITANEFYVDLDDGSNGDIANSRIRKIFTFTNNIIINQNVIVKIVCKKRTNDRIVSLFIDGVKASPEEHIFLLDGDIYDETTGGMFGFRNAPNYSNNWKFTGILKTLKIINQEKIDDLNNKKTNKILEIDAHTNKITELNNLITDIDTEVSIINPKIGATGTIQTEINTKTTELNTLNSTISQNETDLNDNKTTLIENKLNILKHYLSNKKEDKLVLEEILKTSLDDLNNIKKIVNDLEDLHDLNKLNKYALKTVSKVNISNYKIKLKNNNNTNESFYLKNPNPVYSESIADTEKYGVNVEGKKLSILSNQLGKKKTRMIETCFKLH